MGFNELKEPYRVSITAAWVGYTNGMLLGIAEINETLYGVIVGEEGRIHALLFDQFLIDWRYDVERDQWFDVSDRNLTVSDQEG
jgi:hypothetical protein